MKILWMTWKDLKHPQSGGAELVNEGIAKPLARDGHEVIFLVASFPGAEAEEIRDGYKIIRLGNRYTVYWYAYRYYKKHLQGWADIVIDEVNTIPFFCKYYAQENTILFAHQLCRKIWFYQMWLPFSLIGYLLEPFYLWLLRDRWVISISESTKRNLMRYGFLEDRISVIPEGIIVKPIESLSNTDKFTEPTLLSLGSIRAMKRTLDQVKAFEIAKKQIPNLKLKIAGSVSDSYGKKVLARIAASDYAHDIEYLGCVDEARKIELMRQCHLIIVTSVKEGWGLVVTEANSQGTPAVVYDVDGLRDSVKDGETGLICTRNTPYGLATAILNVFCDASGYAKLRESAWLWSKNFHLEKSYRSFIATIRS